MAENDYSKKQREHAAKIASERAVMDTTGMSRSQLRSIERVQTAFQQRQQRQQQEQKSVPKPHAEVKSNVTAFEPTKLTLEQPQPNVPLGDTTGASAALGPLTDIIIVFNGTAYYCNINGEQDSPV